MLALAALVLTACGTRTAPPGDRIEAHRLTVYTSLQFNGPAASAAHAVLAGERAALAAVRGHIGGLDVRLVALDDSLPTSPSWDPGQTTEAAHVALVDPTTVGYLGDFDSGASAVSIPLLNRVGIPQLSPTSTAVGLTTDGPGASPGEPAKYYPTGRRTFVALAPDDASQAAAQVHVQRAAGCARTDVLNDESFAGYDAAASFGLIAHADGLDVVGSQSFNPRSPDFSSLVRSVVGLAPDCALISAMPGPGAALLTREVAAGLPGAHVFATAPLDVPSFLRAAAGGLPAAVAARVRITVPAIPPIVPGQRPPWAALTDWHARYGYAGMRMLLGAIRSATHDGRDAVRRSAVMAALLRGHDREGPLGALSVRPDGTTTLSGWSATGVSGSAPTR